MTRLKNRGVAALAAVLSVGVMSAIQPAPATAAPAPTRIKVAQYNTDQVPAAWQEAKAALKRNDVVLVQEVCHGWLANRPAGTAYSFHPQTYRASGTKPCPVVAGFTQWKGNVVMRLGKGAAHKHAYYKGRYAKVPTTQPKRKNFGVACLDFGLRGHKVTACSTHIQVYGYDADGNEAKGYPVTKYQHEQTKALVGLTNRWTPTRKVIVGGDFNMKPKKAPLTRIYSYGGTGKFVEADQLATKGAARAGRPTTDSADRKIDYIFFEGKHVRLSSKDTLKICGKAECASGHRMLQANVRLI